MSIKAITISGLLTLAGVTQVSAGTCTEPTNNFTMELRGDDTAILDRTTGKWHRFTESVEQARSWSAIIADATGHTNKRVIMITTEIGPVYIAVAQSDVCG